jgi:hypothetical protein
MSGFNLIPKGMVPLEENGNVKEEYKEQAETMANEYKEAQETPEATTEETTSDTVDNTEASTDEIKSEESNAGNTAEETTQTEETTEEVVSQEETPQEETQEEESSLHDEQLPYSADDLVSDYNSNIEEGDATFQELIAMKYEDIDSLDPIDLLERAMIFDTEDISDEELDVAIEEYDPLFESKEEQQRMIEDGEMTERGFKILEAKFNRETRDAKAKLKQFQDGIDLKEIAINGLAQPKTAPEATGLTDEQVAEVKTTMTESFKDYNNETLKVVSEKGETLMELDYGVNEQAKAEAIELASNPNGIFARWMNEDGTLNDRKYLSDIVRLQNMEGIIKATYDQAASSKTEEMVRETNNISETTKRSSKTGEAAKTAHDFLADIANRRNS